MRLKVFALFLAIQLGALGGWHWTAQGFQGDSQPASFSAHAAALRPALPSADASGPQALISLRHSDAQAEASHAPDADLIETVLSALPAAHARTVEQVILDYHPQAQRGLGGKRLVILGALAMEPEEMASVLVHEVAHNVDEFLLSSSTSAAASPFYDGPQALGEGDPSLDFYRLSWTDSHTLKKGVGNLDFVSGYAMSDPFEDFAETYLYYLLHNRDFQALAASSAILQAKYAFMRDRVFEGQVPDTGRGWVAVKSRPWDATLLEHAAL